MLAPSRPRMSYFLQQLLLRLRSIADIPLIVRLKISYSLPPSSTNLSCLPAKSMPVKSVLWLLRLASYGPNTSLKITVRLALLLWMASNNLVFEHWTGFWSVPPLTVPTTRNCTAAAAARSWNISWSITWNQLPPNAPPLTILIPLTAIKRPRSLKVSSAHPHW